MGLIWNLPPLPNPWLSYTLPPPRICSAEKLKKSSFMHAGFLHRNDLLLYGSFIMQHSLSHIRFFSVSKKVHIIRFPFVYIQ
jgi:hypothetical protein